MILIPATKVVSYSDFLVKNINLYTNQIIINFCLRTYSCEVSSSLGFIIHDEMFDSFQFDRYFRWNKEVEMEMLLLLHTLTHNVMVNIEPYSVLGQ